MEIRCFQALYSLSEKKSLSRYIGLYNYRIALKFGRHLGSCWCACRLSEQLEKFLNFARSCSETSVRLVNIVPGSCPGRSPCISHMSSQNTFLFVFDPNSIRKYLSPFIIRTPKWWRKYNAHFPCKHTTPGWCLILASVYVMAPNWCLILASVYVMAPKLKVPQNLFSNT